MDILIEVGTVSGQTVSGPNTIKLKCVFVALRKVTKKREKNED